VVERRAEQAARNAAHAAKSPEALLARLEDLELRTEKLEKK
jgi:hypothetical protein